MEANALITQNQSAVISVSALKDSQENDVKQVGDKKFKSFNFQLFILSRSTIYWDLLLEQTITYIILSL